MFDPLVLLTTNDPLFSTFVIAYPTIFLLAILTLGFSVILRSKGVFFIQVLLFLAMFVLGKMMIDPLFLPLSLIQILFTIFIIYRTIKAIDRSYLLVMEKTNQIERKITEDRSTGTESSFY